MKLLIDTEKKTIEVYGDESIVGVIYKISTTNFGEYKITPAPQSLLGSVPKIEYNSDSTDKPIH